MTDLSPVLGVIVAAIGGAAIGVERQRSGHAAGPNAHLGGIRTFTLLGGAAGLAGFLAALGYSGVAIALASGALALVVVAYAAVSRRDVDATTEVAAVVVVAAGFLAGIGWLALSSGAIALTTLLLVEKSRLHALVARIDDEELRAAARFAVMAVVVLPLLPPGPFQAIGGVKPRELWMLVLFFSGLSFGGFLARRMVGPAHGYPLAGLLGGVVSSTTVTFTFARLSRAEQILSGALALGTVGACTIVFPRVLIASVVLNPSVARALTPFLAAPFAIGVVIFLFWLRRLSSLAGPKDGPSNPLQIGPALQMAATFQVVLFAVQLVRRLFGDTGLLVSGAVLGLTDVDALTISMARTSANGVDAKVAAQAITIGILANCGLKTAIALIFGTPEFRRFTSAALAAMMAALALSLYVFR
jgi:uncharacterized membrane protein (DUF4010 family)